MLDDMKKPADDLRLDLKRSAELSGKDAEISQKKAEIPRKDAEIARLKALLEQRQ